MNNQEVNKTIADFMGVAMESFLTNNWRSYTESLDALIPVWEKLIYNSKLQPSDFEFNPHNEGWSFGFLINSGINSEDITEKFPFVGADGKTIQEAAAKATAEAIKQLNRGDL